MTVTEKVEIPKCFSVEVPGAADIPGEGKPRVHYLTIEREYRVQQMGRKTLWDMFERGRSISGHQPFLGYRIVQSQPTKGAIDTDSSVSESITQPEPRALHYVWITYNEAHDRVIHLAKALALLGIQPKNKVGIFSKNCVEYLLTELAVWRQGACTVPIYDTLVANPDVLEYMVNLTEITILFAQAHHVDLILKSSSKMPKLKYIVTLDSFLKSSVFEQSSEVQVMNLYDLEQMGRLGTLSLNEEKVSQEAASNLLYPLPSSKDLACICFTSGTTGMPKGVMITHSMLTSVHDRVSLGAEHGIDIPVTSEDVHLSYLPKAHVFEMTLETCVMAAGARIGFWQGTVHKLMDDIAELKPTMLASTPRVYNRIYNKVLSQVSHSSGLTQTLFFAAMHGKRLWLHRGQHYNHAIWDKMIFSKIRETLGGRIRVLYTGAAPITKEVAEFLKIAFCCPLVEGYGQTESVAATTVTPAVDKDALGTVGVPIPGVQVKLVDVPDMGYLTNQTPPKGEVWYKGPTAFHGYFKDPEKTSETIQDGWVASGDIGMWDAKGHLCIIDRKKNLFKLAQGEYVSPEKIENVYSRHELIESIFVHGESTESHLVAIVIPERKALKDLLSKADIHSEIPESDDSTELNVFLSQKEVRSLILSKINSWVREEKLLNGFEIVKDLTLVSDSFESAGLLTPTFKLKRHEAKKFYQSQIRAMYDE